MTMYKRVIYRQKHSLFVISGTVPRPDMSRVRSAPPPDIEPFTQQFVDLKISAPVEKGLVLKNKDGLVITEEMLANLSDSSSEEEEIEKTEVLKKKEEEKHSVVEKQELIEDKKINEELKEEEKQSMEIKEMIKEEIKKEVKEAIKETVKEEIKEKLKESPLYTFKVPKDLKELIDKEPSKQDHFQESTNNAIPREMPKFSLFSGKDSSEKKEGTPYIYQMPTLITPKTVYKKPDQGTSRKKLLTNRIKRVYKVDELLHFKERNSVPLIYDRSLFMKAEMSEAEKLESKVYDTVSLYRRELNRLAKSTYEKVIREIKKLTINTNEEMTQIAEITFEKAVKETSFQDLYIGLIKALKNSFFSIEEGGEKQKSHSVFWSVICHKCKDVFTNKESWVNELALKENSFRSFEERCKFEDEFEEKEGERIKKKGRIFGTIKLFANFFNCGMISDNFILIIITQLKTNMTDQENVEMLCHLFENCGEKLMKRNEKIFNEIIEAMKANINIYEQKVRFVILNLIELKIPAWKVAPKKSLFGTNTFAGLKIVKDVSQVTEEKKPEIDYNSLFKNIRLVLTEEGSDISALRQNVIKSIKDRNKVEFMNEFFFNISENYEIVDETVLFFLSLANLFKKEEIITSLKETFYLLDDLKYDAPFCYGNFYKLTLYLQSEAIISEEDISSLKISTFDNEKNKILKQWLDNFDNNLRIERVSSDDKVINLLNECVKESGEDRFICYLKKYNLIQ